jgi:uncharacterized protein (DUF4415 family)
MKEDAMKKAMGEHGLTEAQWTQLRALRGTPDIGDIPPAPAENWATARRGVFYRPRKAAISIRLDMDVLDWLRSQGPGYQTTINRILRERMEAEAQAPAK